MPSSSSGSTFVTDVSTASNSAVSTRAVRSSSTERRTAFVVRQGIVVLRFPTDLVFRELTAVLESIGAVLRDDPSP